MHNTYSKPNRVEVIDFLKGFSIFTIVVYHLISFYIGGIPNVIKTASQIGGTGVHVFLLCSGFGLFYSHLNKPLKTGEFIKKRLSKVYIPYVLVVFVSALLPFMYAGKDTIQALVSHVFLFKMFSENYVASFGIQFWFVSTIFQLYFVFNVLTKLKNKLGNKYFLAFCMMISVGWWIVVSLAEKSDLRVWNSFFLQYLWEFGTGMVLADMYYHKKIKLDLNINKFVMLLIGLVCTGIYGYLGIVGGNFKIFNDIPALLGYGSLALFVYKLNINFLNKVFLWISKFSYEWYLLHILVFEIVYRLLQNVLPSILVGVFALVLSIGASYLYNKMFKFKFISKKEKALS